MKRQMWAFLAALAAAIATVVALATGAFAWAAGSGLLTVAAGAAARIWSRRDPGPMPYLMRWILLAPRPGQSPRRLQRLLAPREGERMLEIGPGIGVHALPVAASLGRAGRLDVVDVQQAMLVDLTRRAAQAGLANLVAIRGDAQRLPYADSVFDAAFLISVLGEIPNPDVALQELHRVLRPNGRLVVGEILIDPDFVPPAALERRARRAGFRLERRSGPPAAYLARFERTQDGSAHQTL